MNKILVIEDETDLREALQTKMLQDGYEVTAVSSAEEGFQLIIQGNNPDLILLDVMTHSLHAATFMLQLRQLPPDKNNIKVIILTNLDNDITRNKVSQYGVEAYLVKAETSLEEISSRVKKSLSLQ